MSRDKTRPKNKKALKNAKKIETKIQTSWITELGKLGDMRD